MTKNQQVAQSAQTSTTPSDPRRWAVLAICCVAAALLGIDTSVLNYAIPSLVTDLKPSGTEILWIADIYGFALGGLLVVMGNLGDRIGRKKLLLLGAGAFGVASVLTAYAASPEMLIGARALLGVAGATIMPSTLSIVRNVFTDPRERTTAVGISGGVGAGSFALGPVVGGALLDHFWWGSVFLINVPVLLAVVIAGAIVLPESRNPDPGRLDWISVPLSIAGLLGVIFAIKTAARDGVHEPSVWIAAAIGVGCLIVFLRRQTRIASPLLDIRLFRNPAFTGSISANLVAIFASASLSLAFSLYFQVVRGWSPLMAGLALLPGPLSAAFAAPLSSALVPRIGRAKVVALGLVLMSVSMVGLGLVTPDSSYWMLLPALIVNGAGITLTFTVTFDTAMASVPKEGAGAAAAISETAMELGGALGIAVLGSVLTGVYRNGLDLPAGVPAGAAQAARESVGGAVGPGAQLSGPMGRQVAETASQAFTHSMHVTTLAGAGLIAVAAVIAFCTLRGVPAVIDEPTDEKHGGKAEGKPGDVADGTDGARELVGS
ncbi:MFS transporter [Streptomyces fildesensis]|uniref:MFS transporter n=1 Tax=Streptomyces fildesensis TaxID=375757 RepID=A0ABW8CF42_9ACTN